MPRKRASNETVRRKAVRRAKKNSDPADPPPTIADLKRDWARLNREQRGDALRRLYRSGVSKRALARSLKVSESLVRQLVTLADLPVDLRKKLQQGKIGRKHALAGARNLRNTELPDQPTTLEADPVKFEEAVQLLIEWIRKWLPGAYREQFIVEIKFGDLGPRRRLFACKKPGQPQRQPSKNPKRLIENHKPKGGRTTSAPDLINFCVEWFADWGQRLWRDDSYRFEVIAEGGRRVRSRYRSLHS